MGEKEIKPASTAGYDRGGVRIATDPNAPPPAGGARTVERPGTGKKPQDPPKLDPYKEPGSSQGWSGSDRYEDGYRMGRTEDGTVYLNNPDGTMGLWDPASETWKGAGGKTMPDDWSSGHRPTKYPNPPIAKP